MSADAAPLGGSHVRSVAVGSDAPSGAARVLLRGSGLELEGDELTFSSRPNPQCPGSGTYQWSIEGDKLHLEPVGTDRCPFRVEWAANRTYTRFD